MTKKKEKIVKYLADGNIAKVGMIVKGHDGNVGKIILIDLSETIQNDTHILVNLINTGWSFTERSKTSLAIPIPSNYKTNKPVWFFRLSATRKATPAERKRYYTELYARNNQ